MPSESLAPDAIISSTNLSGAVTDIDDDPDSPDGAWLTATSAVTATDLRISFPTPTGNPTTGADLQAFRALLRKTAGTPTPTIDMELYETGGGSALATLLDGTSITSTTGEVVEGTWNASLLGTPSGSAVQCRIVSTPGSTTETPPVLTAGAAELVGTLASALTLVYPASLAAGDIIGAFFIGQGRTTSVPDVTVPAGWTALAEDIGANNQCKIWVLIRDARSDGTETGNMPNFTVATPGTAGVVAGVSFKINGVATSSFTEQAASDTGQGVTVTHDAVTTQGTNRLVVSFVGIGGAQAPSSFSDELDSVFSDSIVLGDSVGGSIQVASVPAASTTISGGTITVTSDDWATYTVAFLPVAAVAVNTVEIGAVEWVANYSAGSPVSLLFPPTRPSMMSMMMR